MVQAWGGAAACVLLFTYVAMLEKRVMATHSSLHLSLSRLFYMLLAVLAVIAAVDPGVLRSREFFRSLRDPTVAQVGALTAIGMLFYYTLLARTRLFVATMVYPVVMVLTVLAAACFMGERPTAIQWVGITLAAAGVAMTVTHA